MQSIGFVNGIDRLRAVAAISVMLAHVVGPSLPSYTKYIFTGFPAVVAFFVISGFCIHTPYIDKPVPVFAFWLARLTRIIAPVAIAWPIATYLGISSYNPIDGYILWSVVCELWYYFLFPFFLWMKNKGVTFELQWIVSMIIALLLAILYGSDQYGNANIYGWSMNWIIGLPSWLLGCILAERRHRGPVQLLRFCAAFGASLLYWLTLNTPAGFYLTGNLYAILCYFWISSEISAATGTSWLDAVGKGSYSIYLFHVIAWTAVESIISVTAFIYIPFILIVCYFFYRLVEYPSHRIARRIYSRLEETKTFA